VIYSDGSFVIEGAEDDRRLPPKLKLMTANEFTKYTKDPPPNGPSRRSSISSVIHSIEGPPYCTVPGTYCSLLYVSVVIKADKGELDY
jgi:hypothetical protein